MPIVEWAESTIVLPRNTPKPGPLVLEPWQVGIMKAYQDPMVNELDLMVSSQRGKSTLMLAMMGYDIDCDPGYCLLVNPGITTLKRFLKEKFLPFVESTPDINNKIRRTIHKNILPDVIEFDGGAIYTAYSGSAASLRSITTKKTFADEVDVYRGNQDTANPLSIIWQRTAAFGDQGKMVVTSTPVESGVSLIEAAFNEGTMSYWYVPCPSCNLYQPIEYEYCRNGVFFCRGCGYGVEEEERLETTPKHLSLIHI